MTDLRKAAEMALEALLEANNIALMELSSDDAYSDEITDLRQALAQDEQEPVMEVQYFGGRQVYVLLKPLNDGTKLYVAPPSKPWVDLSEEEKTNIASTKNKSRHWLVWATEAALRSKNNG